MNRPRLGQLRGAGLRPPNATVARCSGLLDHCGWIGSRLPLAPGSARRCRGLVCRDEPLAVYSIASQLRLVARLDLGLTFRLAEPGLIVNDLADARKA